MDKQYNDIIYKLNTYNSSHPQFILLWKTFLENKMTNLQRALNKCNTFLENIENNNDIDYSTLLVILYFFNN